MYLYHLEESVSEQKIPAKSVAFDDLIVKGSSQIPKFVFVIFICFI